MLELWDIVCNGIFDPLLGWLLALSWTATLIVVALGTGLILAGIRKFTTNQDLLRRIADDKKRLKELVREAKSAGDKEAQKRMRQTVALVGLKALAQEGKPLLLTILPIAILATWCYNRLGYHPPRAGEPVQVAFYGPLSAVGETVTLLPQEHLSADGWVKLARQESVRGQPAAAATWTVRAAAGDKPYRLVFRWRDETFARGELLVGGRTCSPRFVTDEEGKLGCEVRLREARPLGIVPGWGETFPPWLVGYLALVIPAAVVIKRVLCVA